MRSRWATGPSVWKRLKRIVASAITSNSGASSGAAVNQSSIALEEDPEVPEEHVALGREVAEEGSA